MTGQKSKSRKGSLTVRPSVQHLSIIKDDDSWETPKELLWSAFLRYDIHPELDVCTTTMIAKRHKFKKYFTVKKSGLKQEWTEDFFMNCPYSEVGTWIAKASQQSTDHRVDGLVLTYAKTDTKWWHLFVENNPQAEVHFIKGRIRFHVKGIPSLNSAPYPSVWIIFRGVKLFSNLLRNPVPM